MKYKRKYWIGFIGLTILILVNLSWAYEKEIRSLSTTMSENIIKAGKKRVAVIDFMDLQGNITELGRFIAEELSVDLTISAKGFEIIDRAHLKTILAEHKLSVSGLVDPNTVKKLGQIAGVDAIVTGSVTPFGDSIRVTSKVIATDTASVIGASKGDIAKTKAIEELLARGIETAPSEPGAATVTPTPQSRQIKAGDKKEMPFFQNDFLKITAKSLKKTGNTMKLILLYENITEKNIRIWLEYYKYLTDENGERWDLKEVENIYDSSRAGGGSTDFPPKLPKMVKLTFSAKDDPNGTIFTAVLDHRELDTSNKFQAVIRNIPLTK